jgi:hypothetical protein
MTDVMARFSWMGWPTGVHADTMCHSAWWPFNARGVFGSINFVSLLQRSLAISPRLPGVPSCTAPYRCLRDCRRKGCRGSRRVCAESRHLCAERVPLNHAPPVTWLVEDASVSGLGWLPDTGSAASPACDCRPPCSESPFPRRRRSTIQAPLGASDNGSESDARESAASKLRRRQYRTG